MINITDKPSLRDYFESQLTLEDYDPYLFGEEEISDVLSEWHGGRDGKNIVAISHDNDFIEPFKIQIDNRLNDRLSMLELKNLAKIIDNNSEFKIEAKEIGRIKSRDNIKIRENLEESVSWLKKYHPQTLGGFRRQEKRRIKEEFGIDLEVF